MGLTWTPTVLIYTDYGVAFQVSKACILVAMYAPNPKVAKFIQSACSNLIFLFEQVLEFGLNGVWNPGPMSKPIEDRA